MRVRVLVIAVTHDLNLAAAYASRMVLMRAGQLAEDRPPARILNVDTLRDVFKVDAQIVTSPSGRPWIHYGS